MDSFALVNNIPAKGADGKRPRVKLTTDERNARTSARQVRRFLSGRVTSELGYLIAGDEWNGPGNAVPLNLKGWSVQTWTGDTLLARVHVTKARVNSFGFRATRFYFTGTDARGRTWHGSSPGPGMFARLHLNKGRAPRKRPTSRAALARALSNLLDAISPPRGQGVPSLPLAGNLNPFSVRAFTDAARAVNGARR